MTRNNFYVIINKSLPVIFILFSITSFGQEIVDTIIEYNGRKAHTKIALDKNGRKLKEVVLFGNGKVESESFYTDSKMVHWIAYDTTGIVVAEWEDPELENTKLKVRRNTILTIAILLLIIATWWLGKKLGYKKTYWIVGYSTVFLTALSSIIQNKTNLDHINELLIMTVLGFLISLPTVLLILSVSNLFRRKGISIFVSIVFGLFSLWILLFYTIAMLTAGAGMLS